MNVPLAGRFSSHRSAAFRLSHRHSVYEVEQIDVRDNGFATQLDTAVLSDQDDPKASLFDVGLVPQPYRIGLGCVSKSCGGFIINDTDYDKVPLFQFQALIGKGLYLSLYSCVACISEDDDDSLLPGQFGEAVHGGYLR
nr:hypothetical protein [Agrobacterium larrymoorei]